MAKRALAFLAEKDSDGFVEALLFSGEEAGKMIRLGLAECPERAKGESVDKAVEAFTTMLAESVVPARERFSGCANAHDFAAATFVRVEPRGAETVCGINSLDSLGVVLNIAGEEKEFFRLDDPALVEGAWKTPEGLRCD